MAAAPEVPATPPRPTGAARSPLRRCAGCRQVAPAGEFLRLVCLPQGRVTPDPGRRLPGRGLNVHPARVCLDRVLAPRALARAFRRPGPFDLAALAGIEGPRVDPR